jgi:hypothetical protein
MKFIFFLLNTSLLFAQSGFNFKITEFGILNYADSKSSASEVILKDKPKMDKSPEILILKKFSPVEQEFEIEVDRKRSITGQGGIRLDIPESIFETKSGQPVKGAVKIYLTEYVDPIDFLSSGYGQVFYNKYGEEQLLYSGGMFKVRFVQNNEDLLLVNSKVIEVQMPDFFPKEEYSLYYLDENKTWNLKSSLSSSKAASSEAVNFGNSKVVGVRIAKISKSGLWNFAYPELEKISLTGKIDSKTDLNFFTIILPDNTLGFHLKEFQNSTFELPSYKSNNLKLFITDGKSKFIIKNGIKTIPDKILDSKQTFKVSVDNLQISEFNPEQFKTKTDLVKFLNIILQSPHIVYKK